MFNDATSTRADSAQGFHMPVGVDHDGRRASNISAGVAPPAPVQAETQRANRAASESDRSVRHVSRIEIRNGHSERKAKAMQHAEKVANKVLGESFRNAVVRLIPRFRGKPGLLAEHIHRALDGHYPGKTIEDVDTAIEDDHDESRRLVSLLEGVLTGGISEARDLRRRIREERAA